MAANQTQLTLRDNKPASSLFTLLDNNQRRRANSEKKPPQKTLPAPPNKRIKQNPPSKPTPTPTPNLYAQKSNAANGDQLNTVKPKSTKIQKKDLKKPFSLAENPQKCPQKNDYADF